MDIRKFFDSVPVEDLLEKVEKSTLLGSQEYHLLSNLLISHSHGLVQGISLSNYLSEIYLEKFDMRLKRIHPRVLYSFRYVSLI